MGKIESSTLYGCFSLFVTECPSAEYNINSDTLKGGLLTMWRRCRCTNRFLGYILAGAGLLIILALLLPNIFWWFVLGIAMIALGLFIICH